MGEIKWRQHNASTVSVMWMCRRGENKVKCNLDSLFCYENVLFGVWRLTVNRVGGFCLKFPGGVTCLTVN